MPYDSVAELPAAVRAKIKSSKRRRQWLHVWNSEYARHGDESRAFASAWATVQRMPKGVQKVSKGLGPMNEEFKFFLPIAKVDKALRTVSGYCSTPALDLDGEIVSLDALKKAAPGYWEWRNIRRMHTADAVGVGKELNIDGNGAFLTAKIVDDDAWKKCLEGVYKGFSIGGKKLNKVGNTITEIEWIETSIVDRPANPECKFDVAKSAKVDPKAGAYLLKLARPPRDPASKALGQMAKAVKTLAKSNPPAAHDGFSLPAKVLDKNDGHVHEIDGTTGPPIEPPIDKRDVSRKERKRLAREGKALPGGGFPIANKDDLDNARQAIGQAKNPLKTRALIRQRAAALGVKLPDSWKKKLAKRLIAEAEQAALLAKISALDLRREPSFLTLSADGGGIKTAEGDDGSGHEPSVERGNSLQKGGLLAESPSFLKLKSKGSPTMTDDTMNLSFDPNDPLGKALVEILAKARQPSRLQRMEMARGNMKKARAAMKECAAAVEAAHKMHKTAYLSKAAKAAKKPANDNDGDADDFDHAGAMEKLQKAYGALQTMKTFIKAANLDIKKAASRAGQRGQEVSDSDAGFYQVPPGVKDLSPSDLSTASPGGDGSGSEPPILGMEQTFPGKVAKRYSKYVDRETAEALARAAAAEAKVEVLEKLPAPANGRRPYAFDTTKLGIGNGNATADSLLKGVDPRALASDDEETRKSAVGRVIGNMITGGHGRTVFDPGFHGTAGAG